MNFILPTLLVLAASCSAQLGSYNLPSLGGGGIFDQGQSSGSFIGSGSSGSFVSDSGFSSGGGSFVSGGDSFSSGGGSFSSGGGSFSSGGGSFSSGGGSFSSGGGISSLGSFSSSGCGNGQVRRGDGTCVRAEISRNIYLYAAPPAQQVQVGPAPQLPQPKVHYNFVFVRTPSTVGQSRPVVVPPPQQKTLVYVLSRRPSAQDQEVIEVPSNPTQPEVFFVNYAPGDNPQLPGGIDLQQALSQSQQQGQFIDGGSGSGGFGGSLGGLVSGGNLGGGFVSGGSSGGGFISGGSSGDGFISGGISGGISDSFDFGASSGSGGFISGSVGDQYGLPN